MRRPRVIAAAFLGFVFILGAGAAAATPAAAAATASAGAAVGATPLFIGDSRLQNPNTGRCAALNADSIFNGNPFVAIACLHGAPSEQLSFVSVGKVMTGWPFSNPKFNSLYPNDDVVAVEVTGQGGGGCMTRDSHSTNVELEPCSSFADSRLWVENGVVRQLVSVLGSDHDGHANFLCDEGSGQQLQSRSDCSASAGQWTYIGL